MNDRIDQQENTVSFERHFEAPPEEVFAAWTDPDQVKMWWDPTGEELVRCTIDLRPNGSFRFETREEAPPFTGTYRELDPPKRIVFEAMGALGTVALEEKDGGTRMKVSIRCPSREHFEMFLKIGVDTGTSITLDNLGKHLNARSHR